MRLASFCAAGIVELQMISWATSIGSIAHEKFAHLVSVAIRWPISLGERA